MVADDPDASAVASAIVRMAADSALALDSAAVAAPVVRMAADSALALDSAAVAAPVVRMAADSALAVDSAVVAVARLLRTRPPIEELQRLEGTLRRVQSGELKPEQVPEQLTGTSDQVRRLTDLFPKTRQDYYTLLLIVVALISLYFIIEASREHAPTTQDITRVIEGVMKEQETHAQTPPSSATEAHHQTGPASSEPKRASREDPEKKRRNDGQERPG